MRRVTVPLSKTGIQQLRREVESYKDGLRGKVDELCRRLAEQGVATAVELAPKDTHFLADGIQLVRRGESDYLVVSQAEYSAFVEFGTGVVGEGTYKGELPASWKYDTRMSPWAHDPEDPTYWFYYDEEGRKHRTRGHAAQPFMARTAEELRQSVLATAREVFS